VIPAAAASFAAEETGMIGFDPREAAGGAIARTALRAMPLGALSVEQSLLLMSPRIMDGAQTMWRQPGLKGTP